MNEGELSRNRNQNQRPSTEAAGARASLLRRALETLPNLLGLARLASAPGLLWLIAQGRLESAFWLFLLAGLSDAIDGPIARRLGVASRFGAILDPLADKSVMAAVYVTGSVCGLIPIWLVVLVVARDLLILLGGLRLFSHAPDRPIRPLRISKTNTGVQIAYAAIVLFDHAHGTPLGSGWQKPAALLVAASTLASGLAYAREWWRVRHADGGNG